jgi:CRP-like cAMP-binding protein
MDSDSSPMLERQAAHSRAVRRSSAEASRRESADRLSELIFRRMEAVQAHPLAELLRCPFATGDLLSSAARSIDFSAGTVIFQQAATCQGLYVVISGQLLRRTVRRETKLTLGVVRAGELVELAAALGDGRHTYTLAAQTPGSVLLLAIESLELAFQRFPPLQMQLLEELAREVSRAYNFCLLSRTVRTR